MIASIHESYLSCVHSNKVFVKFLSIIRSIKILLNTGAHINLCDHDGQTAIQIYITTHRVSRSIVDDRLMLLFAAEETVEGTKVGRYHFWRGCV